VAELGDEVGLSPNRLYYHVRRLVECGLVRQVDARASGRHTERIYGRTAATIRLAGDVNLPEGGLLAGIAVELDEAVRRATGDDVGSVSYHRPRLSPSTARELETRLRELVAECADLEETGAGAARYGVLGVVVPLDVEAG
jgi:DNA-binding Lrp family transcriptional regulator